MLLPDNIHPNNSVYYNGAFVIKSLQRNSNYELLDLYQKIREKKEITFSMFILCLDWLYLLEIIKLNSDGKIEVCL